ncbi:MAG: NfeD family protein [Elainellaceae cyanobacterium]
MNFEELFISQSSHTLWILGGVSLLGLGLFVGEPSLAAIGLAAIITAIAALSVPSISVQLIIWSILSVSLAVVMRGMVPQQATDFRRQVEAEVTGVIPPGRAGEVTFEGSLWKAKCQIPDLEVHEGEIVHVVGRQANTLIVLPLSFLDP